MKKFFTFVGVLSFALAGCSGLQNSPNSADAADANAAAAESQFAYITDAQTALTEGLRLMDENQTETAIEALKQAVKLNPDLADAHFNLGIAYALLEMQREQSGVVTEPETNSNSKQAPKKTSSEKAFAKAVEAYKKWLKANPEDDVAYYNLGRTYAKLTKDEDAEEAFREAAKLKPEETEYQTELGAILIKLAQYRDAITPLKKAIELDEGNARAIDLLEDAEAGRKRVDYVPANKNANQANSNKNVNSDTEANSNSSSNSVSKPPASNTKPKIDETKKPNIPANKPKQT